MGTDVESLRQQQFQLRQQKQQKSAKGIYSDPFTLIKTFTILGAAVYGLDQMQVYHHILHSHVDHFWFKIGLACTIAVVMIKSYLELFKGKIQKQKINYVNFKHETHALIFLIMTASGAFHMALWPVYGMQTILIMFMFGYGFLLQVVLLLPAWVQNMTCIVVLTLFLQQYK